MNVFKTAVAVRAYTERPDHKPLGSLPPKLGLTASKWTVVFDCETSIDATQRLRVGFFQIREGSKLKGHGVFFEPDAITEAEERLIREYANSCELGVMTVAQFRTDVLLKYGYRRHATSAQRC
jgi:hypothetical protein